MFKRKPKVNNSLSKKRSLAGLAVLQAMAQSGVENPMFGFNAGGQYYPMPNPKNSKAASQQRAAKKLKAKRARMSKRK